MTQRVEQAGVLVLSESDGGSARTEQMGFLVLGLLGSVSRIEQAGTLVLARAIPKVIFTDNQTEYES